jgi:hypothetical protein
MRSISLNAGSVKSPWLTSQRTFGQMNHSEMPAPERCGEPIHAIAKQKGDSAWIDYSLSDALLRLGQLCWQEPRLAYSVDRVLRSFT